MRKLLFIFPVITPIVVGLSFLYLGRLPSLNSSSPRQPQSSSRIFASLPKEPPGQVAEVVTADARPIILENYFGYYKSELYPFAHLIVQISDEFGLDFRLLPAIAMQESTLCKFIPPDSHNCWGYGIYGDKVVKFDSYEDAVRTVAKTISTDYFTRGLFTPYQIMSRYTPPSDGSWAEAVTLFLDIMEKGGIPE